MIICLIVVLPLTAQMQDWIWHKDTVAFCNEIETDSQGNSYIIGNFSGIVDFDDTTLNSASGSKFFGKLNSAGRWMWVMQVSGYIGIGDVALDQEGNIYVIGDGWGMFGAIGISQYIPPYYVFVLKLAPSGALLWRRQYFQWGSGADGQQIAVDSSGNYYFSGYTSDDMSEPNVNDPCVYAAKYSQEGTFCWVASAHFNTHRDIRELKASDDGWCYLIVDNYLLKANSNNMQTLLYVQGYSIASIALDENGLLCLTGNFSGTVQFGTTSLTSVGSNDIYVAKLTANGSWLWARQAGGTGGGDDVRSITTDTEGNGIVCGDYWDTADFGEHSLLSNGGADMFIAKIDATGNWMWAKSDGGSEYDSGIDVGVDGSGYVYALRGHCISKAAPPSLKLLSPQGGEKWQAQSAQTVYWYPSGDILFANVLLSLNNGASWFYLNSSPVEVANGRFTFTTPFAQSTSCLIRIESNLDPNIWFDVSDATFSLLLVVPAAVSLTGPDEPGLKLQTDRTCGISWDLNQVNSVDLDVSYDYGETWNSVSTNLGSSINGYSWNIPDSLYNGCYFRIVNTLDPNVYDWSDHPFTICKLEVGSPPEGDVWVEGTTQNIAWEHGNIDNIRIEYSTDGGSLWQLVTVETSAATGNLSWVVPKLFSNRCRLRVSDVEKPGIYDISDYLFTIRPQIMLISPNGGEYLLANSIHRILWDSTPEVSQVLLDYSINNGATWQPIQATPYNAGLGYYDWIVPNMPGGQALVRVKKSGNTAIYDVSESVFSIVTQIIPPTAGFEADVVYGLDSLAVTFYDLSQPGTGLITSWEWDFGDGGTSGEQHPQHTYLLPGVYEVSLTVTNSFMATNTLVRSAYITVVQSVPELTLISDMTMSFGPVYVQESSAYQPLSIQNTGGAMMTATNIHFMGQSSHFEFLPPPGVTAIFPGESYTVMVRFNPQTVGAIQDTIYIENNSVNEPLLKVKLTGTGLHVLPASPQGVSITMVGNSVQLDWEAVTQNLHGYPMTPDYYFVYISSNPISGYVLSSVSTTNSAQHPFVAIGAEKVFYRITAVKFYRDESIEADGGDPLSQIRIGMKPEEVEGILMKLDSYGSSE